MRPAKRWPAAISAAAVIGASMGLAAPALADVSEESTAETAVEQTSPVGNADDVETNDGAADDRGAEGADAENDDTEGAAGEEAAAPTDEGEAGEASESDGAGEVPASSGGSEAETSVTVEPEGEDPFEIPVSTIEVESDASPTTVDLQILNINDFHGRIDGTLSEGKDALTSSLAIRFAATIDQLRDDFGAERTALLSAGDNVGATLFASSIADDVPTVAMLNALGLEATAVGNHEFDKGWLDVQDRLEALFDGPILGANVYEKGTNTPVLPEYTILDVDGVKLGVIGVVTTETPVTTNPNNVSMLDFGDPVVAVNRVTAKLLAMDEAQRPDLIVAEFHEGTTASSLEAAKADADVFRRMVEDTDPAVAAILTGHSHRAYLWDAPIPGEDGKTRPVLQAGSYGADVASVVFHLDSETHEVVSYDAKIVKTIAEDKGNPNQISDLVSAYEIEDVYEIVLAAVQDAEKQGSAQVGTVTAPITRAFDKGTYVDGKFTAEGNGGSWNDPSALTTLVGNMLKESMSQLADAPDFGVLNPGGVRTNLMGDADGVITVADARAVLPFNNELAIATMTGEQVYEMLEQQWQNNDGKCNVLTLGLSDNISYTYTLDDSGDCTVATVHSVTIDGVPVDREGTYRAGTFNFLAAGGDNFHVFTGTDVLDTGLLDWESWNAYLATNSPISPVFTRPGVQLAEAPVTELAAGEDVSFTLLNTNVPSLGAPENTTATASIVFPRPSARAALATAEVVDGETTLSLTVPDGLEGGGILRIAVDPSGTVVEIPVTTEASDVDLVQILNINDFHGRIDGTLVKDPDGVPISMSSSLTMEFANTLEGLREQYPSDATLFLSAGDNVGASLFPSALLLDVPTVEVLNALGLDATATGNHEFDAGWKDLNERLAELFDGPILGANVYAEGTQTPLLPEYAMLEASGLKVAVIGVVTQETATLVNPAMIEGLEFGNPVEAVNRVVGTLDALPADEQPDLIVAEFHEGGPENEPPASLEQEMADSPTFKEIVEETSAQVDAIFTGHTHKGYAFEAPIPGTDRTRPIMQTGCYGANIAQLVFQVNRETGEVTTQISHLVPVPAAGATPMDEMLTNPVLAEVYEIVFDALANADKEGSAVTGYLSAPVTRAYSAGIYDDEGTFQLSDGSAEDRGEASAMGTLVANMLQEALEGLANQVDFGVVNPGGLRTDLYPASDGAITVAQARAVLPFNNELSLVTLTGDQIVTMLEQQWQRDADGSVPSRAYLQLGLSDNVAYTYSVIEDPEIEGATKGVIQSVTIDGVPLDLDEEYTIGTFSFLAAGGDNFHVFQDAVDSVNPGALDWEAWLAYLKANSTQENPIEPDFVRQGVRVEGLPSGDVEAGGELELVYSGMNIHSVGAPANTELTVSVDPLTRSVVTVPIETVRSETGVWTDSATVSLVVPEVEGVAVIDASAAPTGTWAVNYVSVAEAAVTPPPGERTPSISVDPAKVVAGGTVTVTGKDFVPGETVSFSIGDKGIEGSVVVGADGTFSVKVAVAKDLKAGTYTLTAKASGGDVATASLVVTAAGAGGGAGGSGSGGLPSTGADVMLVVLAALVLAGAGVATKRFAGARRS